MDNVTDTFGEKVGKFGQRVLTKTQNLAEIASLNAELDSMAKQLTLLYCEIGKQYHKKYAGMENDAFPTLSAEATALVNSIAEKKERAATLRGFKTCASCGAEVPYEAVFCSACGANVAVQGAQGKEQNTQAGVCSNCGKPLEKDSVFCTGCGTKQ